MSTLTKVSGSVAADTMEVGNTSSYSVGMASCSGLVISGSGTSWTSDMVGGMIVFSSGQRLLIVGFTDAQTLATNVSSTVASSLYTINYGGINSAGGSLFAPQLSVYGSQNQLVFGPAGARVTLNAAGASSNVTLTVPTDQSGELVTLDKAQTLTNKTITDASNVVKATQLATAGADVLIGAAGVPSAGQVLTADGAGGASWQTPAGGGGTLQPLNYGTINHTALTTQTLVNGSDNSSAYSTWDIHYPYAYCMSGSNYSSDSNSYLWIYDISAQTPTLVSSTLVFAPAYNQTNCSLSVKCLGDYAYVSGTTYDQYGNQRARIYVLDIKNRSAPTVLKQFNLPDQSGNTEAWTNTYHCMLIDGGLMYVFYIDQNGYGYLSIYGLEDPANPTLVGRVILNSYSTYFQYGRMAIRGKYLYIVGTTGGIFDVSDAANPSFVGLFQDDNPYTFWDVQIQNNLMFIGFDTGVSIYNLDNPTNPQRLYFGEGLDQVGYFTRLLPRGNLLYGVTDSWSPSSVYVWNITNPSAPTQVDKFDLADQPPGIQDIWIEHGRMFLYAYDSGAHLDCYLYTYDLGGNYIQTLRTGAFDAAHITVDGDVEAQSLKAQSLEVLGSALISGSLSVSTVRALSVRTQQATFQQVKKVSVSSAEILALKSAPKELLPNPLGGTAYILSNVSMVYKHGGNGYADGSPNLMVFYGSANGPSPVSVAVDMTSNSTDSFGMALPAFSNADPASIAATSLVLSHQGAAEFSTGDGSLDIYLTYQILDL
jgi:hypothetical protein